jgi:hypothetical protein
MSQLQEASPRAGASGVSAGPAPSASFYTHQIANSVRLGNSGYLKRTPSGAGNRQTWTFSTWLKLTELGTSTNSDFSRCYFKCRYKWTSIWFLSFKL